MINLSHRTKEVLKGLGWVVLICLFAYVSVQLFKQTSQETIKSIIENAEKNQKVIKAELDSSRQTNTRLYNEILFLRGELRQHEEALNNLRTEYKNSHNELIKIQNNEKNFINTGLSSDEQFIFITKYQYIPYKGASK